MVTVAVCQETVRDEIGQSEGSATLRAACDSERSDSSAVCNWDVERIMWSDAVALALRRKFRKAE